MRFRLCFRQYSPCVAGWLHITHIPASFFSRCLCAILRAYPLYLSGCSCLCARYLSLPFSWHPGQYLCPRTGGAFPQHVHNPNPASHSLSVILYLPIYHICPLRSYRPKIYLQCSPPVSVHRTSFFHPTFSPCLFRITTFVYTDTSPPIGFYLISMCQ